MLDGKTKLSDIVEILTKRYDASQEAIQKDVVNLVDKLIKKKFIFEV